MSDEEEAAASDEVEPFSVWVEETLAIMEHPGVGAGKFCPEWWRHPEAVARLKALWVSYWPALGKGELSQWWVNEWDAHARALFDPSTGVFRDCGTTHREHDKPTIAALAEEGQDRQDDAYDAATGQGNPRWV